MLANPGQGPVGRQVAVVPRSAAGKWATTRPEVSYHLVQGVDIGPMEVAVVHGEARRLGAGGHALHILHGEQAVVAGSAGLNPEGPLRVVEQFLAPQKLTRHVGADADQIPAYGMELEHFVEAAGPQDLGCRGSGHLGDLDHGRRGDPPLLLLGQVEQRDDRRPGTRVTVDDFAGRPLVRRVEVTHRSTSPMMGSTDEMTATPSAIRPPSMRWGSVWRFTKLGPRMCIRYGFGPPSDTR